MDDPNPGSSDKPVEPRDEQEESPHWQHTMWAMVVVQLVISAAFSMLAPIMPLFLPELGVTAPRQIDLWSGILNASTPFVAAFFSPVWGRLSDRHGRKPMLLRSSLAVCFFAGLMGLSVNVWQFFACRTLMGVFAGFSATAIALVASQVPERRLGYALGWLATGQLVGSLLGPVMGGAVADLSGSNRVPFYLTSLFTLALTLLINVIVHERFSPPAETARRQSRFHGLRLMNSAAGLIPLFFVLLLAQFAVRTVQPLITLYVQDLVGNVAGLATLSGFAFSITGIADLIASPFLGKRSDVIGYRRVLLICLLGATLTSVPQAFVGSYSMFLAERFAMGLFIGGVLPTANALIGRMVSRADRGTIYGLTSSATFLGNSFGPLTGGAVAATIGLRWVFLVPAALLAANLIWVYRTVPEFTDR
jgi:DHA1 family multidrug resistance protein-like MFS transporter